MLHNHKEKNEGHTAITDSEQMKTIPKDYFVTKGQRVNKEMMENDPKCLDLKGKVQAMIDSALKEVISIIPYVKIWDLSVSSVLHTSLILYVTGKTSGSSLGS